MATVDRLMFLFEEVNKSLKMYESVLAIIGAFYVGKTSLIIARNILIGLRVHILSKLWKQDFRKYGKWAVVTGCTDGIGKSYARELARHGMSIILISRSAEKLETVAEEIEKDFNVETHVIQADFSKGREIYPRINKELAGKEIGVLGVNYLIVVVVILQVAVFATAQFSINNQNSVRVCIQSANEVQLKSQCVICLRDSYNFLMSLCCRVPYLPLNITIEQGSCVIEACQQQKLETGGSGISTLFNRLMSLFRGRRDTSESHLSNYLRTWHQRRSNQANIVPQADNVKNYFDTFYSNVSETDK